MAQEVDFGTAEAHYGGTTYQGLAASFSCDLAPGAKLAGRHSLVRAPVAACEDDKTRPNARHRALGGQKTSNRLCPCAPLQQTSIKAQPDRG
jgi:hypothetical protein